MTTPVLTEDGKRLAKALVEAKAMDPQYLDAGDLAALNTAAASLRLPLEGDASLREACKPWAAYVGEPPDDDSPLSAVFGAGMGHCERLLAKLLSVPSYEHGDGSEDFDNDATMTLVNILAAAGLYDKDENQPITLSPQTGSAGEDPKTPDAGVDPSRKLKEALFACLNVGDEFRQYGGVLMADGRKAWVRFTAETPEASALLASQPHSRPVGAAQAPEVLTPTAPAGEDETGVREALVADVLHYIQSSEDGLSRVPRQLLCRIEDVLRSGAVPQPPKAETPAGVVWGIEDTGDDIWIGPMRPDGAKVDQVIYHRDLKDYGPEYRRRARADAKLTVDGINAALSTAPAARPGDEVNELREALVEIKKIGLVTRTRASNSEQDWKNAVVRMEREAEQALAAAPAADGGRA